MNALFSHIKSDKILLLGFSISASSIFLGVIIVALFFGKLPNLLPLYNQLPWGQDRLGNKSELLIPVLLSLGICILNAYLSMMFYSKLPLVSRFLAATSMVASFLILAFLARTIQLII